LIFNLIINSGIFSFVFGYVGNFKTDGTPYFLFYMTGSVVWDFFSNCFFGNTMVLMENSYLFGKVYFPRLIMPISNVLFNLIRTGIKFGVTLIVWLGFYFSGNAQMISFKILGVIPLVLLGGIMGMSLGMIVSCLTIKYRDFTHMTSLLITMLMYFSPVMYTTGQLPAAAQKYMYLNPMSAVVEAFRYCMIGGAPINWNALCYSLICTIVITIIALVYFNQTEKDFIDII
ncbi:MAG: ABC transporter permease, partial [Pseudobutyrivibrio sp.]|nr:ABC transporter permease [Pseudobutyrivibrio sp.]